MTGFVVHVKNIKVCKQCAFRTWYVNQFLKRIPDAFVVWDALTDLNLHYE